MLGAYPSSVSWIQFQAMGSGAAVAPYTRDEEIGLRRTLSLTDAPSQMSTREVAEWSEINDRTFFNYPAAGCSQLQKDFTSNLDAANQKYTSSKQFEGLYQDMASTLGVSRDKLNFKTAHVYLDDYVVGQANKRQVPVFPEQALEDQRIKDYYKTFEYEGQLGSSNSVARVVSHSFLNYVLTTMYGKVQSLKQNIDNSHYQNLKYSQFVGNENLLAASNRMLGADPQGPPKFGDNLRFELYESQGQYYVKTTQNGSPVRFAGTSDGVLSFEAFSNFVYQQLYFGNVDRYCSGEEDPTKNAYPVYSTYEEYLKAKNSEFSVVKAAQKPVTVAKAQTAPKQTTNKDDGWYEQGFVEVEQKKSAPRVVEVVEPTYVAQPRPAPQRAYYERRPEYVHQQRAPVYTQQYQAAAPAYSQPRQAAAPVSQPASFSKMVETSDYVFPTAVQHKPEK